MILKLGAREGSIRSTSSLFLPVLLDLISLCPFFVGVVAGTDPVILFSLCGRKMKSDRNWDHTFFFFFFKFCPIVLSRTRLLYAMCDPSKQMSIFPQTFFLSRSWVGFVNTCNLVTLNSLSLASIGPTARLLSSTRRQGMCQTIQIF